MKVDDSSQFTKEDFRRETKRSPSEQDSIKGSNIFVNNPLYHNNLISTIGGKQF